MNTVNLIGRITKELELRATANGTSVCTFNIAINRPNVSKDDKDKQQADFLQCVVWKTQAENLCKYQGKGSLIAVEGSIRNDAYESTDGTTKYRQYVLANRIEYLGNSKKNNTNTEETKEEEFEDFNPDLELNADDDLPF